VEIRLGHFFTHVLFSLGWQSKLLLLADAVMPAEEALLGGL
jgi:hypothetical protein